MYCTFLILFYLSSSDCVGLIYKALGEIALAKSFLNKALNDDFNPKEEIHYQLGMPV
jgi:hypothetical protein